MLTTLIILLREFLEASLLISLLLLSRKKLLDYHLPHWPLLGASVVGVLLYARYLGEISSWFDGLGQEYLNGAMLLIVATAIVWHLAAILLSRKLAASITAMLIIVLSISREGAEVTVYLHGMLQNPRQQVASIWVGSIMGAGLGLCSGVLAFYSIYYLERALSVKIIFGLFVLIGAGLSAEACQYLIQAGLIDSGAPLWDTSAWIAENSIAGQLLHAVFAYEATPTAQEVLIWLLTGSFALVLLVFLKQHRNRQSP